MSADKAGKYNFSRRHWLIIFVGFLLFFLANAVTSDSENVILPLLSEENGWDYYGVVLTLITVSGCVSIVGTLILGKLCEKMGARILTVICLFATAFFVLLYGTSKSYPVLIIGLIGTISFGQSISFLGGNAIIANWFPRKKGLAMGIVSVGPPVATVIMVSLLTFIVKSAGVKSGIMTLCGVLIVVAIIVLIFVKDTPEQLGLTPDNLSVEEIDALEAAEKDKNKVKGTVLTTAQIIRKKEFWLMAVIIGIIGICETGLMAQWIVRYNDTVFESAAGLLMSICAVVGIFGSILSGYLENRWGTQKSYAFMAVWFTVALILNFTGIPVLVYISIPMFGLVITLIQIYLAAFELSAFGRENFKQVNGIMFPILSACSQSAFLIIAACKGIFGEVRYTYLVFAALLLISLIFNFLLPINKNKED